MSFPIRTTVVALFALGVAGIGLGQNPKLYEENVSASDPLRATQAKELDEYIKLLIQDRTRFRTLFHPDYRSVDAYERSKKAFRKRFLDSISYPPPSLEINDKSTFTEIGVDDIGTYYRVQIPIVTGVHSEGIYIVPKNVKGRVPLIVSMHGGGGSPEVALFHGGANYHDMVRGGVKLGYAVYAPQHLFNAPGYPRDIRNQIDERLKAVGTSLTAVEIAKITRAIDVLIKRPEIDGNRIGMVGLSYGGYYALVTPAVDSRIKVSVSSCYFGVQEFRFDADPLGIPSDFRFMDRFSLLRDPDLAALICPRALMIQAGANDDAAHRDYGILLSPMVQDYYKRVGQPKNFVFDLFQGGHEFNDKSAWEFVKAHL